MHNPDTYYQRTEVSNSDLTAIKHLIHPGCDINPAAREAAFRAGTLVDALITEPHRVNHYELTVDDIYYSDNEFRWGKEMRRALFTEAHRDKFLAKVLSDFETQRVMVNHGQQFEYAGLQFSLDTRCKWDWYSPLCGFGGDLKTVSATSQAEFSDSVDFFDWDRSRAWYMDIAHSDRDFIYAISKRTFQVFKLFINRGDKIYNNGRSKYEELAFNYWCLAL